MTTFHVREKTHQAVLPQPQALESVGADNPEGGDETAHGHPASRVLAVEHGRGEIEQSGTRSDRRHPEGASAPEGADREAHPAVFVLDKHGQPLRPVPPGPRPPPAGGGPGRGGPAHPVRHPAAATAPPPTPPSRACRSASTPAANTPASPCSPNMTGAGPAGTRSNLIIGAGRSATSSPSGPRGAGAAAPATCATARPGSTTAPSRRGGSRRPCNTASTPPCPG